MLMPTSGGGPHVVQFGGFELDLRSGELTTEGEHHLLAEQTFRLLALLIRERGQVVSRDAIQRELWKDDTFVDFELSLNAAVKRLRETLGDSATTPRFIQTLPKRGYRFIAQVTVRGAVLAEVPPASDHAMPTQPARLLTPRWRGAWWVLPAIVIVTAVLSLQMRQPHGDAGLATGATARVTSLTADGTVRLASVSRDGKGLTYVTASGSQESLWLRPERGAKALLLVPPADGTFRSITFGPDAYVYYQFFRPDRTHVSLYRVSIDGGEPALVSESAGNIAFSPDGRHYAYTASYSLGRRESRVTVVDVTSGTTRIVASRVPPTEFQRGRPAWSPDGRRLALIVRDERRPFAQDVVIVDTRDGREQAKTPLDVEMVEEVLWPSNDRLLVSARERRTRPMHVWSVSLPTGRRQQLTRDAGDYRLSGLSHDGRGIIAVRHQGSWTLWGSEAASGRPARQIARGTGALDLVEGIAWTPDGRLVYTDIQSGNLDLWLIDPLTGQRRRLTSHGAEDFHPAVSPDGTTLVFSSTRSGTAAIWAMPLEDEQPRRLTHGADRWPSFAPDGQWVAFQRGMADTSVEAAWRVGLDGGDAEQIGPAHSLRPVVSPDGRAIAHYWMHTEAWAVALTRVGEKLPALVLPVSKTHGSRVLRWTPDGRHLLFIDSAGGTRNLWQMPLNGGRPRRLTALSDGRLVTFDVSRDGSRLAWLEAQSSGDVVAIDWF